MKSIKLNLRHGYKPVVITIEDYKIKELQYRWIPSTRSEGNRVQVATTDTVACLYLNDHLTNEQVKRFARGLRDANQPSVKLGHKVMAIQVIKLGLGWPEDLQHGPTSHFGCLPAREWMLMVSKPPVEADHLLLNQPDKTVWILAPHAGGGDPIGFQYRSISNIEQKANRVLITIDPNSTVELAGAVLVELNDEPAAIRIKQDLLQGRVRRILLNEAVKDVIVFPHFNVCRGTTSSAENGSIPYTSVSCGEDEIKEDLISSALNSPPEEVVAALAERWRR